MTDTMPLADLMRHYTPGDGNSWEDEMDWLEEHHWFKLHNLRMNINRFGTREPILLGDDGRVWDGHHRITAAYQLGIKHVPVEHAMGDDDA